MKLLVLAWTLAMMLSANVALAAAGDTPSDTARRVVVYVT
jgi:hypothetical protein